MLETRCLSFLLLKKIEWENKRKSPPTSRLKTTTRFFFRINSWYSHECFENFDYWLQIKPLEDRLIKGMKFLINVHVLKSHYHVAENAWSPTENKLKLSKYFRRTYLNTSHLRMKLIEKLELEKTWFLFRNYNGN